ncbi:PREDICTED: glucan endo-1,3-beta-D-glucosidase [Tarenaya hassleriana]|uniref:glucan endo-1,3-beta-D-glucosidase n=1 Tax=Tarenaya hassleriana TaxID=28532 RepID=UPI00053C648A|nr:PREDICTED: glucan endo-1,3-beta-D-glucosidase [Tarenaya hassleriana]
MAVSLYSLILIFFCLSLAFNPSNSQPFIGVNYGEVADNLPPPPETAKLLQSTTIQKLRLYGSDPGIIKALANTGIEIIIGTSNNDVPGLASDPVYARNWVQINVVPYFPASKISLVTVGNEVTTFGDSNLMAQLAPAMRNVQNALDAAGLGGGKIRVSTVHTMAVLGASEPPSAGKFNPGLGDVLKGVLEFNNQTGSPFAVNPYPYFAYRADPRPETLSFCLFQPNSGRFDSNTKIKYMNMFDAQVDAVRSALDGMGFKNVEIVVAETGWPYKGDPNEVGATVENAKAYNENLVSHLRSMVGTPLMPGKSVDTYLFALYDEDLKPGPMSERAFGLFRPDLTMTYDVGLSKSSSSGGNNQAPATPKTPATSPRSPATTPAPNKNTNWCVPKAGVSDSQLQANIDYVCGTQALDCSAIQPGGSCFEPNTVASHATYAMNLLFHAAGSNPWNCDFSQTATLTSNNPSYNGCTYASGST